MGEIDTCFGRKYEFIGAHNSIAQSLNSIWKKLEAQPEYASDDAIESTMKDLEVIGERARIDPLCAELSYADQGAPFRSFLR